MAKNNHTITGLDIGTSQIRVLVAAKKPDSENLEILSRAEIPSFGIRRGVVVDVDEVSHRIHDGLRGLQEEIGRKIEDVYVNVGGSHIFATPSHGSVVVSRADQKISEEDKNRVLQAAESSFPLPLNKEILDISPKEFVVDNQRQIKNPTGMQGLRLEVDVLALCAFSPYVKNLTTAVLNAGFQISNIVPSAVASSRAVLSPQQKELGVCLLDIGAGTTDMVIYEEGDLAHLAVFPVGSERITNDLAVGFKTDVEVAEQIKKEFGTCALKGSGKKERIDLAGKLGNGESLVFSHKMLAKIIEARVSEIFNLVQQEIRKFSPKGVLLPAGIVLTGGGVKLPKIVEIARKELKLPARIGLPRGIDGLDSDPAWSAAAGLVLSGYDLERDLGLAPAISGQGVLTGFKRIFSIFKTHD